MADSTSPKTLDDVMRKYDKESNTRLWSGWQAITIKSFLVLVALTCIGMTLFSTQLPEIQLSTFMGLVTLAGFLLFPASKRHPGCFPWYDCLLTVIAPGCFFYHAIRALDVIHMMGRIGTTEIIIGIIGMLCLAELCRRCVGLPILCVATALLFYAFINKLSYGTPARLVFRDLTNTLFYSTSGLLGTPLNVCFTYIVLFIIFGAFLERTGISEFFVSLANRLAGWSSGGPAKVAVISSALCGMVSGSSVGNTVTTGSVTIPMMKKTGYKPEFAAAVEASASTGGQLMPPIMGAAAFLMSEYMGIPYRQVALKAIIPAVLFFSGIFITVHLEARKLKLKGLDKDTLPRWHYLVTNCYLLIPLLLLIWLVASGLRTMAFSAAVSIIAASMIGYIHFLITPSHTSPTVKHRIKTAARSSATAAYEALAAGTRGTITVAVACAIAGIISGCITSTGLASSLINMIIMLSGNAFIVGLLLTMFCCIVLGMGVPTTANYCIMASTCAPILTQLGFAPVASHFFVFYFGIVADITPPVALAAFAGAAIARANPIKTSLNATRLAIAAFVVPYMFAYNPEMLLEGLEGSPVAIALQLALMIVSALIGLFGISAALCGFLFRRLHLVAKFLLAIGGLMLIYPGLTTDLIGLPLILAVTLFQYFKHKPSQLS